MSFFICIFFPLNRVSFTSMMCLFDFVIVLSVNSYLLIKLITL